MTEVTQDEWDAARTTFYRVLNNWQDQSGDTRAQMAEMMKVIESNLEMFRKAQKQEEQAQAARRRGTAAERKKIRDALIPVWCKENLKPGMVVKVKANSNSKFRRVEGVSGGEITGRHCHFDSRGDLVLDGYITNHVLRNVQGIVYSIDARRKPIVTPIMEVIESPQDLNT